MATLEMDVSGLGDVKFGEDIRQKEFCMRPQATFLNNGSYGTVPKRIHEMHKRYLDVMESDPDEWFWNLAAQKWNESRQAVAEFVNADTEDVMFVMNATTGVNTVLRSCKFSAGDAVMTSSLTYGSLKLLWKDMAESKICPEGVEAVLMEVKLPIVSEDDLVQQYDHFLTHHPHVKLVLIDHISSPSGILMPVKRLAAVCHEHGAMVMVDGAHAPGQVLLNLRELNVDFYTGNLYKWAFSPRGCALLWVKREHHSWVLPPLTSWERGKSLSEQFFNQGTRDYIPFFCARYGLQFIQALGGLERVVGYTSDLATRGRDLLAKELGLERMDIPLSMESPNLRLLKLPGVPPYCSGSDRRAEVLKLHNKIAEEYDLHAYFNWVDGALYLRISTQVFNTMEDYRKLLPALRRVRDDCVPYNGS